MNKGYTWLRYKYCTIIQYGPIQHGFEWYYLRIRRFTPVKTEGTYNQRLVRQNKKNHPRHPAPNLHAHFTYLAKRAN